MKSKFKLGLKIAGLIVAIEALSITLAVVVFFILFLKPEKDETSDIRDYNSCIGENAKEPYMNKWGMDESIFPEKITDDMNVQDFYIQYYNPWDEQYLARLVIQYDEQQYQKEMERLTALEPTEYIGYYGVTGFDERYSLAAIYADRYQGFVYALTDNKDTVIYIELNFCNYFMDIDYTKYIKQEYLPIGFDATMNNPYEEKIMHGAQKGE